LAWRDQGRHPPSGRDAVNVVPRLWLRFGGPIDLVRPFVLAPSRMRHGARSGSLVQYNLAGPYTHD
jgi:hypothetical protein